MSFRILFCFFFVISINLLYAQYDVELELEKGKENLRQHNYTDALIHLNRVIPFDEYYEEAAFLKAKVLYEYHSYPDTIISLLRSITFEKKKGDLDYYLSRTYHRLYKFDSAQFYAERFLAKSHDYLKRHSMAGYCTPFLNKSNLNLAGFPKSHFKLYTNFNSADRNYNLQYFNDPKNGDTLLFMNGRGNEKFRTWYQLKYELSDKEMKQVLLETCVWNWSKKEVHSASKQKMFPLYYNGETWSVNLMEEGRYVTYRYDTGDLDGKGKRIYLVNPVKKSVAEILADDTRKFIIYHAFDEKDGLNNICISQILFDEIITEPIKIDAASSEYEDISPFYDSTANRIYFSSNRPVSFGGYDMFYCDYDTRKGEFMAPVHMQFPLNTYANETGYIPLSVDAVLVSADGRPQQPNSTIYKTNYMEVNLTAQIRLAKSYFNVGDYIDALLIYNQLIDEYPENKVLRDYAFECKLKALPNHFSNLTQESYDQVLQLLNESPNRSLSVLENDFWHARAHQDNYHFDSAYFYYQSFLKNETKIENVYEHALAVDFSANYKAIKKAYATKNKVEIQKITALSTPDHDYEPFFYFNKKREANVLFLSTSQKYRDMAVKFEGACGKSHFPMNTVLYNEVRNEFEYSSCEMIQTQGVLPNGNLVFDMCNGCGTYYSSKLDGSLIENREEINFSKKEIDLEKMLSSKLPIIFLDKYDTENDSYDLYASQQISTFQWSKPTLIRAIATPYDEFTPWYDYETERLYFASNRPSSLGSYDIYYSQYNSSTGSFSAAQNIGFPINTTGSEMSFRMISEKEAIYSSDGHKDAEHSDIYRIYFQK